MIRNKLRNNLALKWRKFHVELRKYLWPDPSFALQKTCSPSLKSVDKFRPIINVSPCHAYVRPKQLDDKHTEEYLVIQFISKIPTAPKTD